MISSSCYFLIAEVKHCLHKKEVFIESFIENLIQDIKEQLSSSAVVECVTAKQREVDLLVGLCMCLCLYSCVCVYVVMKR